MRHSMSKIFDSRDTEYKSPFGAAVCGATVRFAVRPGDENVTGVRAGGHC